MTGIFYFPEENHLSMAGHAGAGTMGNDLICAALSALTRVLILEAEQKGDYVLQGDGWVELQLGNGSRETMDAVCRALKWMAEEYPEYVSFSERARP